MNENYLICDVNSIFCSSYFKMNKVLPYAKDKLGLSVCGTIGFFNTLFKASKYVKNGIDHIVMAHDCEGSSNYRRTIYPGYKSQRSNNPKNFTEDIQNLITNKLPLLGINPISAPEYEGDDIIASACKHIVSVNPNANIYILSGDGDMEQCVKYSERVILLKTQPKWRVVKYTEVLDKWCVEDPNDIVVLKSIIGDSSDNIKGVKGYALKRALKVFKKPGFLKEHNDTIELYKKLVSFRDDYPIEIQPYSINDETLTLLAEQLMSERIMERKHLILKNFN